MFEYDVNINCYKSTIKVNLYKIINIVTRLINIWIKYIINRIINKENFIN